MECVLKIALMEKKTKSWAIKHSRHFIHFVWECWERRGALELPTWNWKHLFCVILRELSLSKEKKLQPKTMNQMQWYVTHTRNSRDENDFRYVLNSQRSRLYMPLTRLRIETTTVCSQTTTKMMIIMMIPLLQLDANILVRQFEVAWARRGINEKLI